MTRRVYRIDLSSWVASFRYPLIMSGTQPTLEVPPLSTVLGLINAAAGSYVRYENAQIGYYFEYAARAFDTELIYMREVNANMKLTNNSRTNVVQREVLFDALLTIYTDDKRIVQYFDDPVFPLFIGRCDALATVDRIVEKDLQSVENAPYVRGQIVPMNGTLLPGTIMALPMHFTDTNPKEPIGMRPYSVISYDHPAKSSLLGYRDYVKDQAVDIIFHEVTI